MKRLFERKALLLLLLSAAVLIAGCSGSKKKKSLLGLEPETLTDDGGAAEGDNPGGAAGDNPGGSAGDNPGGSAGDNPGGSAGDNPGGSAGDNPGGGTETSDPGDGTGTPDPASPAAPTLTASAGKVSVSWGPVSGATGYDVHWTLGSADFASSKKSGAGVPGLSHEFAASTRGTYYAWVVARNAAGESAPSAYGTVDVSENHYTVVYLIGDRGPGGGWVFYDDESDGVDDIPGYRYLEAAPADLIDPSDGDTRIEWGTVDGFGVPGAEGAAIGTGKQNTADLVLHFPGENYAANASDSYVVNGYSDWFLPSKEELKAMYDHLHLSGYGGFGGNGYWSSSEFRSSGAWLVDMGVDRVYGNYRGGGFCVRPVRAF